MDRERLSGISTAWTRLFDAHGDESAAARSAQAAIIDRYSQAAFRYLLKILGSRDAAEEVLQQFALHLVQGGFRHATPERGRFRDYLKVSLARLAHRYQRQQGRLCQREFNDEEPKLATVASVEELEKAFLASCRDELLGRTWRRLKEESGDAGPLLFSVLEYRSDHPQVASAEMAAELSRRLDRDPPFTPAGIRKLLQRARERFADHLLAEVSGTLPDPGRATVEQELIELGLHGYCRSAFQRRYGQP